MIADAVCRAWHIKSNRRVHLIIRGFLLKHMLVIQAAKLPIKLAKTRPKATP